MSYRATWKSLVASRAFDIGRGIGVHFLVVLGARRGRNEVEPASGMVARKLGRERRGEQKARMEKLDETVDAILRREHT
jgi:hypothetical protein